MQYRKFGRLDWEVSAASLGIVRVETVVREDDGIDWDERAKAAAYAFDSGVNFVNLGYPTYFRDSEQRSLSAERSLVWRAAAQKRLSMF